jgi:hypothetical protein
MDEKAKQARAYILEKPFQPYLILAGKARSLP